MTRDGEGVDGEGVDRKQGEGETWRRVGRGNCGQYVK